VRDARASARASAPIPSGAQAPVLEASHASMVCDDLRVPYRLAPGGPPAGDLPERHPLRAGAILRWRDRRGAERRLMHPVPDAGGRVPGGRTAAGEFRLGDIPLFGRVVGDELVRDWLAGAGDGWRPTEPVTDAAGRHVASIWRAADGSAFLPFDPDEMARNLLTEAYQGIGGGSAAARARTVARKLYYLARPALPRRVQIAMRRAFAPVQARARFPRWPVEPALHDLQDRVLALHAELAGEPLPHLAPWPHGHRSALVLTHDVETAVGLEHLHLLRDAELAAGVRSSWNLVPERYETDDATVRELVDAGFEVGVHGLRHDGRDIDSLPRLKRRLPAMRAAAERWGAVGFRAPALHRVWSHMPLLGFDYDSSYPDADPYEPQPGGCCSWLPFFNGDLVELPVTLPQDHTVFVLLGADDEAMWRAKADAVAERGGMALLITHPDYMIDVPRLRAYERFLAVSAGRDDVWVPLPREAAAWWRRRAASRVEWIGGRWQVTGPAAAEATIAYAGGPR
jgi:peptidoglycan/xylan/chitin deacetylase (PgdA/CDA1 family)